MSKNKLIGIATGALGFFSPYNYFPGLIIGLCAGYVSILCLWGAIHTWKLKPRKYLITILGILLMGSVVTGFVYWFSSSVVTDQNFNNYWFWTGGLVGLVIMIPARKLIETRQEIENRRRACYPRPALNYIVILLCSKIVSPS